MPDAYRSTGSRRITMTFAAGAKNCNTKPNQQCVM